MFLQKSVKAMYWYFGRIIIIIIIIILFLLNGVLVFFNNQPDALFIQIYSVWLWLLVSPSFLELTSN
jgi:hypothetical protein